MNKPNREWRVVVSRVGDIGSVTAKDEDEARCAALSKFGEMGDRRTSERRSNTKPLIYEDDDFSVRPS